MVRMLCSLVCLAATAAAQSRLHVPAQYPDLAGAVTAARDGDTIEFAPGGHWVGGVRIDKSLTILAEGARLFGSLNGPVELPLTLAIPAGKRFELRGGSLGLFAALALVVDHCQGQVTILDLVDSAAAIRVFDSPQVLIGRCTWTGGFTAWYELSPTFPALAAHDSTVVLDRCVLQGPRANYETGRTSSGAAACDGSDVRCVDCVFRGGDASRSLSGVPDLPGAGAIHAVGGRLRLTGALSVVAAGTFAAELALTMSGGQLILEPGVDPTMTLTGTALVRAARPTVLATNVLAGQTANLRLQSPVGTFGALLVGFPADRFVVPGFVGDAWIEPTTLCVAALGVQGGALAWNAAVPATWPLPVQFRWQGAVFDAGTVTLTDPGAALLF